MTNKNWIEYFQDTTHKTVSIFSYFLRLLPNERKDAIDKEYFAQKILSPTHLVPKPYLKFAPANKLLPNFILEQKIDFTPTYKKDNSFIREAGKTLKLIHDFSRGKKGEIFKNIGPDPLLVNGIYDPQVILRLFIINPFRKLKKNKPELINRTVEKTITKIVKEVDALSRKVDYKEEYCSLIHGDLNDTNIVRKPKGGLAYLDWADCRWDISSCDVAQFIYLHKLTANERKLFLKSYGSDWITKEMIEIHRLLLVGWDIIYLMTINLEIPEDKEDRLLPIKNRIWGI